MAPPCREERREFFRTIAEAAFLADLKHYHLLRPVLVRLKEMHPEKDL